MPNNPMAREISDFCYNVDKQKRNRNCLSDIGEDHYQGLQYFLYDPVSFQIKVDMDLFRGSILNLTRGYVDSGVATIMGNPLRPEGVPASSDRKDTRSAAVATAIAELHWRMNNSRLKRFRRTASVLRGGNMFSCVEWDPSVMGDFVLSGPQLEMFPKVTGITPMEVVPLSNGTFRATAPIGGTVERNVLGNLVLAENGIESWEDVTRFAVVQYLPIHRAKQIYPNASKELEPDVVQNIRGYNDAYGYTWDPGFPNQQNRIRFDAGGMLLRTVHFWERMESGYWDRAVCCGSSNEILLAHNKNIAMNPYTHYGFKQTFCFWCDSMYDDMYRIQLHLNKLQTRQMQYLMKCAKDRMFLPSRSKYTPTNDPLTIVEFDATGQPPVFIPMNPVLLQTLAEIMNGLEHKLERVSQISPISQGVLPDRVSGRSVQTAIQTNASPLLAVAEVLKASDEIMMKKVVDISRRKMGINRLAPLMGPYAETFLREFNGADVLSGTTLRMIEVDASKEGKAIRADIGMQLFGEGAFQDQQLPAMNRMVEWVATGEMENVKPEIQRLNERQADEHCDLIISGQIVFSPSQITAPTPEPGQTPTVADPRSTVQPYGPLVYRDTFMPVVREYQDHATQSQVIVTRLMYPGVAPMHQQMMLQLMREHQTMAQQASDAAAKAQLDQVALNSAAQAEGPARNIALSAALKAEEDLRSGGKASEGGSSEKVPESPAAGGVKGQSTRAISGAAPYGSQSEAPAPA